MFLDLWMSKDRLHKIYMSLYNSLYNNSEQKKKGLIQISLNRGDM